MFRPKELPDLSIVEASALIRRRAISPVELVRAQLDRIAALDAALHAFVAVADDAIETATRADAEIGAGEWRGPLHGIPFAVKDLIDVRGLRTSCGSRLTEGHVAEQRCGCRCQTEERRRHLSREARPDRIRHRRTRLRPALAAGPQSHGTSTSKPEAHRAARPPQSRRASSSSPSAPTPPALSALRRRSAA